ncbi:MAG: hypothetical protein V3V52_10130 [Candidatus Adiutricales bacterium]
MARIKIKDLPADMTLSKDELKRVKGGLLTTTLRVFPKVELTFGKVESGSGDLLTDPTFQMDKY